MNALRKIKLNWGFQSEKRRSSPKKENKNIVFLHIIIWYQMNDL